MTKKLKILVTGSKGFLGTHTINHMKAQGHTVKGIDMQSLRYLPNLENLLYNSDQKIAFQQWMMEKIDQAEKQTAMLGQVDHISFDTYHPDHHGHRKWADYILGEVL